MGMVYLVQGIDVKSMGRIFIGLVKCGAWGCFDEFNRLEEAVLSAVSMQIQVIQDAIKNRLPQAELLNRNVWVYEFSVLKYVGFSPGRTFLYSSYVYMLLYSMFRHLNLFMPQN